MGHDRNVLGPAPGSHNRLPAILIVDGDDDTRELYRTILAPVAESILEADDGVAALEAAIRGSISSMRADRAPIAC